MAVPNIFGTATSAIPLSQLDTNFATPVTIGNTAVQLGNTVTSFGNVTLTNVTISSGNVTVSAGSNTSPSITTVGDTNTGIFFPAADTIAFTEGGVEAARFDSSGRLGIANTSPSVNLEIGADTSTVRALAVRYSSVPAYLSNSYDGTLGLSTLSANNYNTSNGSSSWSAFQNTGFGSSAIQLAVSTGGADIRFLTAAAANTNPTERARIDSSGNLLVGTTNSSGTVGAGFKVLGGRPVTVNADTANTTTVYELYSTGAAAYRFYVGMGGTIFATSAVITPITSDERLKQNIVDYSNGLSQVLGLRPRYFEYKKEPGRKLAGFISQEVQTVMPEAIVPTREDPEMMTYSIDWYPLFVKAIQEQQALITQLTARITALEGA